MPEEPEQAGDIEDPPASSALTRRKRLTIGFLLIGLALLVVGLAIQELRSRGTRDVGGVTVANYRAVARVDDRPAPAFTMPALDGDGQISLGDFRGKVVVLNFWASWCGPCRREAPGLVSTWESYRSKGVQFLGVNYRDDRAAARAYEDEFGITYPSVFDPSGKLAADYRLVGLPTTFIIDPRGQIVYQFIGYTDAPLLQSAIDDVLGRGQA